MRHRTHLPKRRAEFTEDPPRKRPRPLPVANSAAGGRPPVGDVGLNGFIFQAPGHLGRVRSKSSSSSSSSSSDTSSGTSSDDTSSNSESASESTSGSSSGSDLDSDSDSTCSSSSDSLVCRVPRPPPSFEHQRRSSQPRYVTSMVSRIYLSASFVHRPDPVPPGFGKPQTHKRNERRRKKRLAEHGSDVVPPTPAGGSNAITLGVAKSVCTPKPATMMMSLRNKNKRRDFKNTISVPSRITFQDNGAAPSLPPTLIPPSERGHLPPRLFVTSVDVEEDIWPMRNDQNWNRKQKKTQKESYGQAVDEADITLDYGKIPDEDMTTSVQTLDYAALESAWVNASPIQERAVLPFGCVVGWQVHQSLTLSMNNFLYGVGAWHKSDYAHTRNDGIPCTSSFRWRRQRSCCKDPSSRIRYSLICRQRFEGRRGGGGISLGPNSRDALEACLYLNASSTGRRE